MKAEQFNNKMEKVTPTLLKTNTPMREAISSKIKLEITLRYLATGDYFKSLEFLYRMPKSTMSLFVPETLVT
nr:unnamed protein product [Callosobruchus chinensis]